MLSSLFKTTIALALVVGMSQTTVTAAELQESIQITITNNFTRDANLQNFRRKKKHKTSAWYKMQTIKAGATVTTSIPRDTRHYRLNLVTGFGSSDGVLGKDICDNNFNAWSINPDGSFTIGSNS